MQITLMIPQHSSGNLPTQNHSRQNSPVPRVINASNSPRQPGIENKISLLREVSARSLSSKLSAMPENSICDGYVKSQVTEIERRTPPRTPPRTPEAESSPRAKETPPQREFIGIAKLNSQDKKGSLLPPRPPRKNSVTMPPESPKNEPLPPIPRNQTVLNGEPVSDSPKKAFPRTNSDAALKRQPLDRGDFNSLRNIGARINSLTHSRNKSPQTVKNVFADYIEALNERLTEQEDGIFMRVHVQPHVLVTTSENKFVWVKAESENHLGNIQRGSKSTLTSILKTLKRASKTSLSSEMQSDITKNVDRLLENETVKRYYDNSSDIRKRIHSIYFKVVYSKLYDDAKLIKHVLKLSEYNILLMCEFLSDIQEEIIKKFKTIYPETPVKADAMNAIMERLNQEEFIETMRPEEKASHLDKLWKNPRELVVSTPQGYHYNVREIIHNTYKACREFRNNTIFIDNLKDYIESMPKERKEGSLLSANPPKVMAKKFLDDHFIGACISTIMSPHSKFLTVQISILPHVIRDIYKRTVKQLEEQGRIHKIDTVKYLDVIRFQTNLINDQTVQWKLLTGTLSEIAKHVPLKEIPIAEHSTKKNKKR